MNSSDAVESTWTRRDFPVLLAAVRHLDSQRSPIEDFDLSEVTGLATDECLSALVALDGSYLECDLTSVAEMGIVRGQASGVTERGRRVTGLWPSGDGLDGLADLLKAAEDTTEDPEERSALRRAAGALYGVGRDVGTDVLSAFVRAQTGL